jgi:acid stress-induced BolA-like protein IbaG/YrbA
MVLRSHFVEATQKLIAGEGHHFVPIVVGRVAAAKGDLAVRQIDEAVA